MKFFLFSSHEEGRLFVLRRIGLCCLMILTALGVYFLNSGFGPWPRLEVPRATYAAGQAQAVISTNSMTEVKSVSGETLIADARPMLIRKYLEVLRSPLAQYTDLIVNAADTNGVDPYLVVAIAQKETGLGRAVPRNCFNAWGWAQTETYTRCFSSWEDGIRKFTEEFGDHYIKRGLVTPEQIVTRYNPISRTWAGDVSHYLETLLEFSS